MKNNKVTYNRNVGKEKNEQNKEKICKNNKYIEIYVEKYLWEIIKSIYKKYIDGI